MPGHPPSSSHPWGEAKTPYLQLGGEGGVRALVEEFYDIIEEGSPVLRAMLPANTNGSRRKLYEYFSGWLGGPQLYTEKRGHPRLRMRHAPFAIGEAEAAEWMRCMRIAMETVGIQGELRAFLDDRLQPLTDHMVNR